MPRTTRKQDPEASKEREQAILAAIAAIKHGQSIRNAAKEYGIPYSTLQDHCTGKVHIIISLKGQ